MSKLDHYIPGQVIGLGVSSVVFSGLVKGIQHEFDASLQVVLKVVKDADAAISEVQSLAPLAPVSQFCNLHDAFFVTGRELHRFAGPKLRAIEDYLGQDIFRDSPDRLAVLVLNMVPGERLIDRFEAQDRNPPRSEGTWLVQGGSTTFIEQVSQRFALLRFDQRKRVLVELAKAIAKKHELHHVHGDLNPANIRWSPKSDEITLIDLGLGKNYGVPGWKSPEHDKLRKGEIDRLPLASDVFALGLWIDRLLPGSRSWGSLVRQCLKPDPTMRPSARDVVNGMRKKIYATRYKYPFLVALLLISALSAILLRQSMPPSLESIFPDNGLAYIEEIKSMDLPSIANPKPIRMKTESYLKRPDITSELRDNLIRSIAWYYFKQLGPLPDSPSSYRPEDIRAIWMGKGKLPAETWVLLKGNELWSGLGWLVGGDSFFLKAELAFPDIRLYFETMDGQQTVITAPPLPYPWTEYEDSKLFLYDSSIESVLENLSINSDYLAVVPYGVKTIFRGVLHFKDNEELVDLLLEAARGDLTRNGNRLQLNPGLGHEYIAWKAGAANLPRISSTRLANYLFEINKLTVGTGEGLIKDVNYLGMKTTNVFWADILRHYCLEEGTGYYIDNGTIHFYKEKPEPNRGSSNESPGADL